MRYLLIVLSAIFYGFLVNAQIIENPNFAMASHPMKVTKIEYLEIGTLIELSIENQSPTGTFCADKNIFNLPDFQNLAGFYI